MRYTVVNTRRAEQDILAAAGWWAEQHSAAQAGVWHIARDELKLGDLGNSVETRVALISTKRFWFVLTGRQRSILRDHHLKCRGYIILPEPRP